jgi:SNF2 family DNA or RNA helicase
LYPEVFSPASSTLFKDAFSLSEGMVDSRFIRRVRDLLEVIMLRRVKDSPSIGMRLPPKTQVTLYAPLSGVQRQLYHQILTGVDQSLSQELPLRPKEEGLKDKRERELMTIFGTNDDYCDESASVIGSGPEKISASDIASKSVFRNVLMELRKVSDA